MMSEQPQPEPLYDWREFKAKASVFIKELQKDRKGAGKGQRKSLGVDLSGRDKEVAVLIAEACELYDVALDDWETRNDPHKPKKTLKKLPKKAMSDVYDYINWTDGIDLDKEWAAHFERFYKKEAKNPGAVRYQPDQRERPLAITPLEPIYFLLEDWWKTKIKRRSFSPDFGFNGEELAYFNPAGRLFYFIARLLDDDYTISNCRWLCDRMRKMRYKAKEGN